MPIPPTTVAPGQPITSAWGNDVVATFGNHQAEYQAGDADINNRLATRIRGGYASVTTDGYGDVTIGFGITFPSPPLIVATLTANPASQPMVIIIHSGGVSTTAFTARVYIAEFGGAAGGAGVNVNWIAFTGWI